MRSRTPFRAAAAAALSVAVVSGAFAATAAADSGSSKKPKTVVAVAKSSDDFSTLVKAVGAAGLVKALKAKGPLTVFAPTNDAFAKIPAADLDALIADEDALASVLTYHVISGRVLAKNLEPSQTVTTLQGDELTITVDEAGVATITDANGNTATITATDLKAKNGVVHVIDSVLTPAS